MRYRFIQAHCTEHRLTGLCRTLGVSRSGYYAWRHRPASARATANARLLEQIQQLHQQTKARYGAVKLWRALSWRACDVGGIAWRGCAASTARGATRPALSHDDEQHRVRPGRAEPSPEVFVAPAVNRIWAGDLTAIATRAGWLYLAVVLDLYSRRVIGWAMSAKPDQHVALKALHMAMTHRRPQPGLIHHSGSRGAYTSIAYQRLLLSMGW